MLHAVLKLVNIDFWFHTGHECLGEGHLTFNTFDWKDWSMQCMQFQRLN